MGNFFYIITHQGEHVALEAEQGKTLAQIVFLSGVVPTPALCSGLGRCGACKVQYLENAPEPLLEEQKIFSSALLEQGWRLACKREALPDVRIRLPRPAHGHGHVRVENTTQVCQGDVVLAVDLGTTSLHWEALCNGEAVRAGSELNPQLGAGSEVMSRLSYATTVLGGAVQLQQLVTRTLQRIVRELEETGTRVCKMCVAGNSVMTYLLLGKSTRGLVRAPYQLDYAGGEMVHLEPVAGRELPRTYVPPLFAPFVGGDLSAGLAWIERGQENAPAYPYILADMGTNGEFILVRSPEDFLCTSVALGPALEGIGLAFGGLAGPGAVVDFELAPRGLVPVLWERGRGEDVTHNDEPVERACVTGVGYLSLLTHLLRVGLLQTNGSFVQEEDAPPPLARALLKNFVRQDGELRFMLQGAGGEAYLLRDDVEEILKVKAAFNMAFFQLLREAGLEPHELEGVYLAGAMGEHVGVRSLESLGFLPPGLGKRVCVLGNSSLGGAGLLLEKKEARQWLEGVSQNVRVIDLAAQSGFDQAFIKRMVFDYVR